MIDWKHLREVVEEAAALPGPERESFLDRVCSGDAELRREAGDLVAASLLDEAYLKPPALAHHDDPVLDLETRIGAYRLLRPLGSGGMGTVYEATRLDPQRRVALKVMRGGLESPASADRFRYEVEVLAGLEHPHIARLYETGIHVEASNGRRELPWFAMEYVEDARPLVRYAREEALSLDERVRLFIQVCQAVHHGHGKGVLHRDLKPDNLLVDARGRPKVIDFGVARATDADLAQATQRTRLGEIVGTLAYMSPEQIAGNKAALDVRSDVYSLGVVFYELLTGSRPYDLGDADLVEAARRIQQVPPRRPSQVDVRVRGDLETIVLKCLAKDPVRRYGSADALARDLERFLGHEPVEAHPPSLAYQVRMFARRNRALVTAACLVVGVSLAAAAVSLIALNRARDSEAAARQEARKAHTLFGMLLENSVDTTRAFVPRLKQLAGGASVTRDMCRAMLDDLATLEELTPVDPEVGVQIAAAYLHLGEVQGDPTSASQLGDRGGCRSSYERALQIAEALQRAHPARGDVTRILAKALTRAGKLASFDKSHDVSTPRLKRAVEVWTTLREAHPDDPACLDGVILATGRRAEDAARSQDMDTFRALRQRQLELATELVSRWPKLVGARWRHASVQSQFACMHLAEEEFPAAARAFAPAIGGFEGLVEEFPDNVLYRMELADALMHGGLTNRHLGRLELADQQTRRALQMFQALRDDDPDNRRVPMMLAMAYKEVASVAESRAEVPGLDPAQRRALLESARDGYQRAMDASGDHMARWIGGFHARVVKELEK